MNLSFNQETKNKYKLKIMLMHQSEFLSEFLFNAFTNQNELLIKQGEFNSREDFKIKKTDFRLFIGKREYTSKRPKLLPEVFYFLTPKSGVSSFERSATEKGFNSEFYDLLDKDIFNGLLKRSVTIETLDNSVLAPILSKNKSINNTDYLIFDRDEINNMFSDIFQVNFNSPKEDIEKKSKEYFIKAQNLKSAHLVSFVERYCLIKQPGSFDTIEKICSTNEDIHIKLSLDNNIIKDDIELFNKYINNLLNDFSPFKDIYTDFSLLYEQSSSFLNIIQSNLDDFKKEDMEFSKKEAKYFYQKSSKEISDLKQIFKVQNKQTNNRSSDLDRLNIVSYQAIRVIDFLEEICTEIQSIKQLSKTNEDIKSFILDIRDQIDKNREFYKIIINKNEALIKLIKAANAKVELKMISDDFFDKTKHIMNQKNTKIEANALEREFESLNIILLKKGINSNKTTSLKIYKEEEISYMDIAIELKRIQDFQITEVMTEEEMALKIERRIKEDIKRNKLEQQQQEIEQEMSSVILKVFGIFSYSKEKAKYSLHNIDNNLNLGLLYTEPYIYLKNDEMFKNFVQTWKENYISILTELNNQEYKPDRLLDFSKNYLDTNILPKLNKPILTRI
jgi:hypothetical protein